MIEKIFLVIFLVSSVAGQELTSDTDQNLDRRLYDLISQLKCVVCQGQSLAESDADISQMIRALIKQKLIAGQEEEEILTWLREKYGDYIFLDPQFNKTTWPLWIFSITILIIGFLITTIFIYRKRQNG